MEWIAEGKWILNENNKKEDQQVCFMRENSSDLNIKWIHDLMDYWKFTVWDSYYENEKEQMFITNGSIIRLTLTFAPMGMVAPLRCQEHHRPSSLIH